VWTNAVLIPTVKVRTLREPNRGLCPGDANRGMWWIYLTLGPQLKLAAGPLCALVQSSLHFHDRAEHM
jgi:hypothetical protein